MAPIDPATGLDLPPRYSRDLSALEALWSRGEEPPIRQVHPRITLVSIPRSSAAHDLTEEGSVPKYALIIASLLTGLSACDRQPVAPADSDAPAYNWMNNSDNGNLRITRFEDGFIACWSDNEAGAATGLRACHSTFPLGDGTETGCGPQSNLDPIQVQWVGVIDEIDLFASWIHQNAKGQLWITVRDLDQPGTCFGSRLVAQGMGTIHNNDNDLFGTPGNNANAWRFGAQGRLRTPAGGTVTYSGHLNFRFNQAAGFKELTSQVAVH